MLKQLPIKKEYLFIAAVLILLSISYQLAFKKTLEAWQVNKQLKAQIAQASDLSIQPAYLDRKNNNLSKIIALYKTDTIAFRSNIISTISLIAQKGNVKLSNVPLEDPLFRNDNFRIQKLSFEGGYFDLLKVLDALNNYKNIGVTRAVLFRLVNSAPNNSENKKLTMELYVEDLK